MPTLFEEYLEGALIRRGAEKCMQFPMYQYRMMTGHGLMHFSIHRDSFNAFFPSSVKTLTLPFFCPSTPEAQQVLRYLDEHFAASLV
jgi:hypothetical protein